MRILLVLLALMTTAQAQGVSYLALCNKTWDCQATVSSFGTGPIITGWLEQSFGQRCECANRLLQTPNRKVIRVHLVNSPCFRNKRCQRHDILHNKTLPSANRGLSNQKSLMFRKFKRIVHRFKRRLDASNGEVACYVSPCLECDLNVKARSSMLSFVSVTLPNCKLVDNPMYGACIRGTICERHGIKPNLSRPCIADMDGAEANSLVDLTEFANNTRHCEISYYWSEWMNCNNGRWLRPTDRNCVTPFSRLNRARLIAWNWLSSR